MELQDRNFRRDIRIANSVFFFVSGFGYSSWAARIPSLQKQLNLNEAELGGVLFALPVGLMVTMPITGYLLSKYSSNRIMLLGSIFFNLVICFPGFTHSLWQLAVVMFFLGSSRNIMNIATNAQSVGVQKHYNHSIITTFHGIWSLAGFAGAGIGYLMVKFHIGAEYHLPAVGILLSLLCFWFYPKSLYQEPVAEKKKIFSLPDAAVIKYALICFACMACENMMSDWGIIYFEKVTGSPNSTAIVSFVVYMVSMTLGRFLGDKLVSRVGVLPILKFSGLFMFFGLLSAVIFPFKGVIFLSFALIGLGVSCVVPLVFSLAGKAATNSGTAIASISTIGYLGFLVVPPLVGFIAQATSLQWAFGILSSLGLLVFLMTIKIKRSTS